MPKVSQIKLGHEDSESTYLVLKSEPTTKGKGSWNICCWHFTPIKLGIIQRQRKYTIVGIKVVFSPSSSSVSLLNQQSFVRESSIPEVLGSEPLHYAWKAVFSPDWGKRELGQYMTLCQTCHHTQPLHSHSLWNQRKNKSLSNRLKSY